MKQRNQPNIDNSFHQVTLSHQYKEDSHKKRIMNTQYRSLNPTQISIEHNRNYEKKQMLESLQNNMNNTNLDQ